MVEQIIKEVLSQSEKEQINLYQNFFKCFKGGYGEGDSFAGIRNPVLRTLSKKYKVISLNETTQLLVHKIHEIRLLALLILELKIKSTKTPEEEKDNIAQIFLNHLNYVNNWDLVDASAYNILGAWVYGKNHAILIDLAKRDSLWNNRVAIIATLYHIRKHSFNETLEIAEILLHHPHDLIHKAVGWMLREIGKRNMEVELAFLKKHYNTMPRTMLRYAIEKFDEPLRQQIMKGTY